MLTRTSLAVQTAFVAIAARIVGAGFRVLEVRDPDPEKVNMLTEPGVVLKREILTISLAWGVALLTNFFVHPLALRRKWNPPLVLTLSLVSGAFGAESIGRMLAYRQAHKQKPVLPPEKPAFPSQPAVPRLKPPDAFSCFTRRPLSGVLRI